MDVPFILGKLAFSATSKTCICCYAQHSALEVPEKVVLKAVKRGQLPWGNWIWMIQMFPSRSDFAECASRHQLDTCRDCLTKHFTSRLETLGTASCDAFMCPEPGCGHVYTPHQVRILAVINQDLFERYDQMLLRKQLADDPEFRWCLRPGYDVGQTYDTRSCEAPAAKGSSEMTYPHRVRCHACDFEFEMCYHHPMPWHRGQTGEQFDDATRRREDDRPSNRWLDDHVKRCPSCNSPVQKNGGCFHMTCTHCRAEFCWLCLADWKKISRRDARGRLIYDQLGHQPECWFWNSQTRPNQVNENDEQDVLRHEEENGLWG